MVSAEYVKVPAAFDSGTSNQTGPGGHAAWSALTRGALRAHLVRIWACRIVQFNWYEKVALTRGLRDALSTGASPTALATDKSSV